MEQNSYSFEIVKELLSGENHIRGIAKNLNMNPMRVLRTIRDLEHKNIIDYRINGKNKSYSFKKTIEARDFIFMTELYKLSKILGKYPLLRAIIGKIHEDKRIKLAVLFGSYAKNLAKPESDIDIFIETKDKDIKKELSLLNSSLSLKIGKINISNLLVKEIIKDHIIIKGVERYYEQIEFFK